MKYFKFKLENILEWQSQVEIDPLNIDKLTIQSDKVYPFYGQATTNNGIISYLSLDESVLNNKFSKPTILIHSNNGNIVYVDKPFYLKDGHGATSVLQSINLDEDIAMYLITSIRKALEKVVTWNEKATKIALKNTYISLPSNDGVEPDYEYMKKIIAECRKRFEINKINVLNKLGLTDGITIQDEKILSKKVDTIPVSVKLLFDIHPTKSYGLTNDKLYSTKGNVPVLSNSSINNGIGGYVDLQPTEKGGIITFSDTTTGADTVFYQPDDFIGYSHIQGMYPWEPKKWTENSMLYFIVAFKKAVGKWYDWSTKLTREICNSIEVDLPININGEIDFDYMNDYIASFKKKVLAKSKVI